MFIVSWVNLPENHGVEAWTSPVLDEREEQHEEIEGYRRPDRCRLGAGESGVPVAELCWEYGISNATWYNWRFIALMRGIA
jgi:hypothetical protein